MKFKIGFKWQSKTGEKRITNFSKGYYEVTEKLGNAEIKTVLPVNVLESLIDRDRREMVYMTIQQKHKERETEKKCKERMEFNDVDGFGNNLPPARKAKMLKDLNAPIKHNGVVSSRKDFIKNCIKGGAVVEPSKNHGHVLKFKDGTLLTEKDVTKTAIEYAKYLTQKGVTADVKSLYLVREDGPFRYKISKWDGGKGPSEVYDLVETRKGIQCNCPAARYRRTCKHPDILKKWLRSKNKEKPIEASLDYEWILERIRVASEYYFDVDPERIHINTKGPIIGLTESGEYLLSLNTLKKTGVAKSQKLNELKKLLPGFTIIEGLS